MLSEVLYSFIFRYDEIKKEYYATGYRPRKILGRMLEKGIEISDDMFKSREVMEKERLESESAGTEGNV